jgi:hypothetical protein
LAATLPSGAIRENVPASGLSVTIMTRSGAPFHGANGEGKTVRSAAFPQEPGAALAGASAAAKSSTAVAAAANRLARRIFVILLMEPRNGAALPHEPHRRITELPKLRQQI